MKKQIYISKGLPLFYRDNFIDISNKMRIDTIVPFYYFIRAMVNEET